MTVRNIASICNMVSGGRRRLRGRARGAARRRKGSPSRTPAGRRGGGGDGPWGGGGGVRAARPEVPGPRARRAGRSPRGGRGGEGPGPPPPSLPADPGARPRVPGCAAVPPPSGCGGGVLEGVGGGEVGGFVGIRGTHPALAVDKALPVSLSALVSF